MELCFSSQTSVVSDDDNARYVDIKHVVPCAGMMVVQPYIYQWAMRRAISGWRAPEHTSYLTSRALSQQPTNSFRVALSPTQLR